MRKSVVLSIAVSLANVAAFGYDWPSSGTATIPDGESAVIVDADIANVANLDAIVLGEGASVVACGLGANLVLGADVSGNGTLAFTNCLSGVELRGDNSGLAGNFSFSNTVVTVASRYGLGGSSSGMSVFAKGDSGTISFAGSGLTNDAPIKIVGSGVKIPNDDAGATMVQNGDLQFDVTKAGGTISFRDVTITGKFVQIGSRGYYYLNVMSGATLRLGVVDVGLSYIQGGGRVQFDDNPEEISITHFPINSNTIAFGIDNVFSPTFSYSAQMGSGDYGIDLMGHDQVVAMITGAWYTPAEGQTVRYVVRSAESATLTFANLTGNRYMPLRFLDKASFDFSGGTLRLVNVSSDTTGGITVSSGTLAMQWNYGWNGTNVLVKSGATLNVDTANAITSGKARLVVESGGTVNVNGNNLAVASASIGGVELEKGEVYTAAQIAELCPGATWLGTGTLTVWEDASGEFVWPTEPGATAKIPMGKTVVVTDEDLPKLATLGGITVKTGSTLCFDGLSGSYDLDVPLSGLGVVVVTNCSRYAIVANNTNFLGHFEFVNSGIVVSNRFALGCAASEPAWFTATSSGSGSFSFMGGGLTNDVALVLAEMPNGCEIPYGTDETLVQNAGITVYDKFRCRNMRITRGTFRQKNLQNVLLSYVSGTLTFEPESSLMLGQFHASSMSSDGLYVYNTTNVSYKGYTHYNYGAGLRFGIEDAFLGKAFACELGEEISQSLGIDLGGTTQRFETVRLFGTYKPNEGDQRHQTVFSSSPAVLMLATVDANTTMPFKFGGMAGFAFAGTTTYTIVNQVSETEGPLSVSSGTLAFKWGAGWCGTDVVVTGGTLKVESSAKDDFFNADGQVGRSLVRVAVSGEGRLDLGKDVRVGYLSVGSRELVRGTYGGSAAGLDAAHTLDCIAGSGTITVDRGARLGITILFR